MKHFFGFLLLAALLSFASTGYSQKAAFRYFTKSINDGSTFFALNGTTGQLHYMHDFGTAAGTWKKFGDPLRTSGSNNLAFATVEFKNGSAFYILETNTGQLHFMLDFGDTPGKWTKYGSTARLVGDYTLQFSAELSGDGTKFTAMDGNTGQVYYMFDIGNDAGIWKSYGSAMK